MQKYLIENNSDNLILFFSGWGCDEYEFEHLKSTSDVLILYNYSDLDLNFDFSKYKNYNLIAFSAGVFVASVINFDFKINKKIAVDGNPYLFDEYFGLSASMQEYLYGLTEDDCDEFVRNYLVKTNEEYKKFHPSKRTIESCRNEFDCLKKIYLNNKQNIKDIYDFALIGDSDAIFNISAQKEFYGSRLNVIENARHNLFFRINSYDELFDMTNKMF